MALADQAAAVSKLGEMGLEIPKLNPEAVIENLVKKDENLGKYLEMIDAAKEEKIERGMSEEEAIQAAEDAKKEVVDKVKEDLKPMVEENIIKMKQEYKTAKEALDSIPVEAQATIALVAIPPAISAPPSAPNPAYTLGVALQTKKSLLKILNTIVSSLTTVMTIANKLKFELPEAIVKLVQTIGVVTNALSIIPG
jgi:hypothetical protein